MSQGRLLNAILSFYQTHYFTFSATDKIGTKVNRLNFLIC